MYWEILYERDNRSRRFKKYLHKCAQFIVCQCHLYDKKSCSEIVNGSRYRISLRIFITLYSSSQLYFEERKSCVVIVPKLTIPHTSQDYLNTSHQSWILRHSYIFCDVWENHWAMMWFVSLRGGVVIKNPIIIFL